MELDLLITELDETTIQIDKMRYLTTVNKLPEASPRCYNQI